MTPRHSVDAQEDVLCQAQRLLQGHALIVTRILRADGVGCVCVLKEGAIRHML